MMKAQTKADESKPAAAAAAVETPDRINAQLRLEMMQQRGFVAPSDAILPPPNKWVIRQTLNGVFLKQIPLPPPSPVGEDSKSGSRDPCILFGRNDLICEIHTDHSSCSRLHAILVFRNEQSSSSKSKSSLKPYIYDNGSTHKTFVNKMEIPSLQFYRLHSGDILTFGTDKVEYELVAK